MTSFFSIFVAIFALVVSLLPILIPILLALVWLVACVALGLIPAFIAKKKGLNFFLFWLFGFACLPAAIIVACVLKPKNADAPIEATAEEVSEAPVEE